MLRLHRAQSTPTPATGDELSYETDRFEILSGQAREDVALSWEQRVLLPAESPLTSSK